MRFRFFIFLICTLCLFPILAIGQTAENTAATITQAKMACDDSTWAIVKKSKNVESYSEFLTACPDSRWVVLARYLMKSLELAESQSKQKRVSLSTKHDVDW